jgi:hypothetical protein
MRGNISDKNLLKRERRMFRRINRYGNPHRYGLLMHIATEYWIYEVTERYRTTMRLRPKFKRSTNKLIEEFLYD